uniref:Lipocalin n=1 Tax=Rhipicephalus zambeziensis TaxID=60191 RepID=A0A224YCB8_9ACAR
MTSATKRCAIAVFYFFLRMLAQPSLADDDRSASQYQISEDYFRYPPMNLTKFLDTDETIWTYYTTSNKLKRCKADQTASITPYETLFTRTYIQNNKSLTKLLWGIFTYESNNPWEPCDAMDVGKKVPFTYNQRKTTYDLRVRNSSVGDPDRECMEMFRDYFARGVKILCLYNNSCQELHQPNF